MNNRYDITRYKGLLKKSSFMRSQNKSLWKDYPQEGKEL
jgi:hypothetical protein